MTLPPIHGLSVVFGIDACAVHVFQPADVLVAAKAFVDTQVDDGVPESRLGNGPGIHALVAEFAGETGIVL